jgi:branched-chain amino acid transport system substrate-binding protein
MGFTRRACSFALALALVLAAPTARAAEPAVLKIGAALSLTGPAAPYGAQQKAGILAAVDELNRTGFVPGVKLAVVIEDDASTKEQGIAVYQRLIAREKVAAIIGPTLSNTATAADPLAQAAKVPVVAVSNTAPRGITDIGDYVWRVSLTEGQVIPGALRRAQARLGFKAAGVLYGNDDAFTQAGYDVMKKALDDMGVKILATQTFAKPDRDYNAQLTSLIALKPDILVVSALVENASGIVAQARQLGWTGPILGGNGFNSAKLIQNAGPASEGVLVGTSWNRVSADPANQAFLKLMASRGVEPDQFCAQAYTGVLAIAQAARLSGGRVGREDVKAGLAKVKGLDTPLGEFSFLPSRDADHEPALQVVKDGKFQIAP